MAIGGQGQLSEDYTVEFRLDKTEIQLDEQISIFYTPQLALSTLPVSGPVRNLSIFLLETNATDGQIDASNTAKLLDIQSNICIYRNIQAECTDTPFESAVPIKSAIETLKHAAFTTKDESRERTFENLFFCFASNTALGDYCKYYSAIFKISPFIGDDQTTTNSTSPTTTSALSGPGRTSQGGGHLKAKRDLILPSPGTLMRVLDSPDSNFIELAPPQGTPQVTFTTSPKSTTILPPSTTSDMTTATNPPNYVATITPESTITDTDSTKSDVRLSVAAKVGIALGALAFALILLILALLFLRRKHARRNQPEQVMLTHSMQTDSFSRNLITEKDDPTASPTTTPIDETALPSQRHSALASYESVPSAPYAGVAAAIPRRKPTAATMASTVSRGLSTTSGTSSSGAMSPRSGEGFEQYHDEPIYGDARHLPQVFPGNTRAMQSPFLSEEGMTAEEMARLEEEERRIDAAIAEAERR
ncbi:hypothetical protein ONS96_012141 [Cadophora gregata f. sp. sojae]|nr:hypothetical protein ONS96_012141 [Cadophora gregata f. sp. sojae]